jgi:opacity protein-like surface antigen
MSTVRTVLIAAVLSGAAAAASAQPYVGAELGLADLRDVTFNLPTAANPLHPTGHDEGSALLLRGGWRFASQGQVTPRAELELSWRDNPVGSFGGTGSVGPGAGRQRALAVMANAIVDFNGFGPWVPSLGVGVGWLRGSAAKIRRDLAPADCCTAIIDGRDSGAAWQVMAGVGYRVHPQWVLGLDLRHLASARSLRYAYRAGCEPEGSVCVAQPGVTQARYASSTLGVSLRRQF